MTSAALPPDKNDRVGNPPWHLVDYWWDFGKETEFTSYEVDFILSNDVDPKVRLYIAPIGLGHLNKVPFYGGIQTQSDGFRTHPHPRRREYIGKGALFSRWNERDIKATRKSAADCLRAADTKATSSACATVARGPKAVTPTACSAAKRK